jgi:3-hydroxyisobutyrate dehydrogenase
MNIMVIAFFGTGLMGFPMIERLLSFGHTVFAWNRTASKAEGLARSGAVVTKGIPGAVREAEVIILMLADRNAIDETMFSGEALDLCGKTVIQMGTIGPQHSGDLKAKIVALGGNYLECPVLGSRKEALDGKLILMAGGDSAVVAQWTPLLKHFGEHVINAGNEKQAAALKLALNQLIASHAVSFSFSLAIIQAYGVNIDHFRDIVKQSTLGAPMFERKLSNWIGRDFIKANFPLKHLLKDVRLIQEAAACQNISVEHMRAVENLLQGAMARGLADQDYSSIINEIAPHD